MRQKVTKTQGDISPWRVRREKSAGVKQVTTEFSNKIYSLCLSHQ